MSLLLGSMAAMGAEPTGKTGDPPDPVVEGQVIDHNGSGVADVEVKLFAADKVDGGQAIATAKTDGYGDFHLFNATPLSGVFVVVFSKQGYAETRRDVELIPGEPSPFIDFAMHGGLTIRGTVVDRRDGTNVAGARIRLSSAGRDWNVVSGDDGSFLIEEVPPGRGIVSADADGLGRAKNDIKSIESAEPLKFELGPERRCRIVTIDWRGERIGGVSVDCIDDVLHDRWMGTTDANGELVIKNLPGSAAMLRAMLSRDDYVSDGDYGRELPLDPDEVETEHRLTLLSAGGVKGTIIDAKTKEPMHGVRVTVGTDLSPALPRAWTDFDGTYDIAGVIPGRNVVTAYVRGSAPDLIEVSVQPGESARGDFEMNEAQQAHGVVLDPDGKPVAGAYVFATSWRQYQTLGAQAMTDKDGRFTLDSLPSDAFEAAVQAPGLAPLTAQTIKPGKREHKFTLTAKVETTSVALKAGEAFPSLELVTLDGKPLKISDLAGKTVLIDFWATWCGPCVADVPELVRVHEALGGRDDFAMINISLDDDQSEKRLREFVGKNKMVWLQVFGEKAGARKAAEACGVTALPTKILLTPDGKVKAAGFGGPNLLETLKSLMDTKDEVTPRKQP